MNEWNLLTYIFLQVITILQQALKKQCSETSKVTNTKNTSRIYDFLGVRPNARLVLLLFRHVPRRVMACLLVQ